MISDDLLERGLAAAADDYDVPPTGVADLLDHLRPAAAASSDATAGGAVPVRRLRRPSPQTWMFSAAAALVVLIVVAFVVGGSNGSNETGGASARSSFSGSSETAGGLVARPSQPNAAKAPTSNGSGAPAAIPLAPNAVGAGGGATDSAGGTTPNVVPHDSLAKIEKTGELDLQVGKGKVGAALTKLTALAQGAGGYVSNSQSIEGDDPTAEATLSIPADSFDHVVAQARLLGTVLSLQTKGVDVTAQYVDLQARLKSLDATRETYLRILAKANTIGEILSVQERVNDVQTQIEQLQGQLKVIAARTAYGTLTVTIDQKAKLAPVVHEQSGFSKAVHRSVDRFVNGVEAIIGIIGPIVLVVLLLGLGWLLARVGYRVVRRQMV